jgi:serine/threonine protein kinase
VSEDPMLNRLLNDRFEIVSLVGRGGMASVYRARDTVLDRVVAIKVFAVDTSEDRARLDSEVRLLSGLNHPNLVTVHDAHLAIGPDDGPSFLVMEFVSGTTLREAIAASNVSGDIIAAVASGISEALHVVHAAGIVHRDVKPPNILIERDAPTLTGVRAKLADFGIAHSIGSTRLTATQTVIGTAAYLSPEQAAGATVTSASDIYSLGLVLLECFTGHTEYPGSPAESLAARLGRDPVVAQSVPGGWSTLLASMLAREPGARPTASEVARRSALLTDELGGSYPGPQIATVESAPTRLLPTISAVAPDSLTMVTTILTNDIAPRPPKSPDGATVRRHFPLRIAVITVAAAIVLAAVVTILVRALPTVIPPPSSPSVTRSSPIPTPTRATATPVPPPAKGKGHGHGKNH